MISSDHFSKMIQAKAIDIGFDACGMCRAVNLKEQETQFKEWLSQGKHANLSYLERKIDLRLDPRLVLEGAQTVIVVLESYYTDAEQPPFSPTLGRYAWLRDYHIRMKEKLAQLDRFIAQRTLVSDYKSRIIQRKFVGK